MSVVYVYIGTSIYVVRGEEERRNERGMREDIDIVCTSGMGERLSRKTNDDSKKSIVKRHAI